MALFFCQAEGKTQQARSSRTVPPSLGNRRRFYTWGSKSGVCDKGQSSEGLAFFFLCIISKQSELASGSLVIGVRQSDNWVRLSLVYRPRALLSEMQKLQGVICYQGA